jgi:hypothetical protein
MALTGWEYWSKNAVGTRLNSDINGMAPQQPSNKRQGLIENRTCLPAGPDTAVTGDENRGGSA